jgi:thioredoxin-like negative regulator of GroEL
MDDFDKLKESSDAVLLYFSHEQCNVCKVLLPKIKELLSGTFPQCELKYVNIKEQGNIAAHYQVFTVPTVLIFFEGKEYYRFSRNIGLKQLEEAIARPYQLLFS